MGLHLFIYGLGKELSLILGENRAIGLDMQDQEQHIVLNDGCTDIFSLSGLWVMFNVEDDGENGENVGYVCVKGADGVVGQGCGLQDNDEITQVVVQVSRQVVVSV